MLSYLNSEIFNLMNRNDAITNKIKECGRAINEKVIVNNKIETMEGFMRTYRESIVSMIRSDIDKRRIIIICPEIDKRFPANIPFIKTKINGKDCSVVDISKYARVYKDENGNIEKVNIDVDKLYSILVPAYIDLHLFYDTVALPSESIKLLSIMWAKMFNKVLIARKIFVGNNERYEAFMYFAMRFFMKYYLQCPDPVVDNISLNYVGTKSKYIMYIENNLEMKGVDLYRNWTTFASTMFSNEITNLSAFTQNGSMMDEKLYLQLFDSSMGKDGAYLALWSVPYFLYCIFATYNQSYCLNDRAWQDVVLSDKKMVPNLMNSLVKEL